MITLPLSAPIVASLKSALQQWLPDVKSSHRVEALARGLGFQTYAALLAACRRNIAVEIVANTQAFGTYLAAHGFAIDPNVLHRAFASAAISVVMEIHPRLTSFGFGIGQPQLLSDGTRETVEQRMARFQDNKTEMRGERFAESFLISHAFLQRVPKTKTIRTHRSSYGIKHIAEKYTCAYPDGAELGPNYVPNGALIAAAIHNGFACDYGLDHLGYEHPNATFNMSKRALDDLACEVRPDGAIAQGRAALAWNRKHARWISRY